MGPTVATTVSRAVRASCLLIVAGAVLVGVSSYSTQYLTLLGLTQPSAGYAVLAAIGIGVLLVWVGVSKLARIRCPLCRERLGIRALAMCIFRRQHKRSCPHCSIPMSRTTVMRRAYGRNIVDIMVEMGQPHSTDKLATEGRLYGWQHAGNTVRVVTDRNGIVIQAAVIADL
jgi:hypothetical protein